MVAKVALVVLAQLHEQLDLLLGAEVALVLLGLQERLQGVLKSLLLDVVQARRERLGHAHVPELLRNLALLVNRVLKHRLHVRATPKHAEEVERREDGLGRRLRRGR